MKSIYKLALLLLLVPSIAFANNNHEKKKHERSKSVSKSFDVNSNATLDISNKFGDVNVTSWDQNRIQIDVQITVKGNDLDDVEDRLEKIQIEFDGSSNLVTARTTIGNNNNWKFWKKSKNISYKINYTVKMPVTNNAKFNNEYGSIWLDELEGNADINCDYGKITIGHLKGNDSSISLDYCSSSTIESMKDGDISVDYSKLTVNEATDIDLSTDYSTVKLKKVNDLDFSTDYGSVEIEQARNVEGSGDYSGLKFGTITNRLKLSADYGSIYVKDLAVGFESVYINSEYAGIKIGTSSNNNFSFVIDLEHAGFKRNDSNIEMYKSIEKNSTKHYEGVYGKGNSNAKVTIKSEYGSVTFYEN
jgi:hypothetical protein